MSNISYYEIVKGTDRDGIKCVTLYGPLEGIMRVKNKKGTPEEKYAFVQVIQGKPRVAYTKEEILVTNRKF